MTAEESKHPKTEAPAEEREETVIHVMPAKPGHIGARSSSGRNFTAVALVLLLVVVGVGIYSYSSKSSTTPSSTSVSSASFSTLAPAQVSITSSGFVPSTISVHVGQDVTWTNNDSASHVVASDPFPTDNAEAPFNSVNNILPDDSFNYTFAKAGTYTYHDDLNPYSVKGTVVVEQ